MIIQYIISSFFPRRLNTSWFILKAHIYRNKKFKEKDGNISD